MFGVIPLSFERIKNKCQNGFILYKYDEAKWGAWCPQQMGKYTILPVYPIFIWKLFLTLSVSVWGIKTTRINIWLISLTDFFISREMCFIIWVLRYPWLAVDICFWYCVTPSHQLETRWWPKVTFCAREPETPCACPKTWIFWWVMRL